MLHKYVVVSLFAIVLVAGCQSNMTAKRIQAKNPMAKNAPKTPTKFVDVWNNFAQSTSDGKVMRGVAGRIHFYADGGKKQTVKVDGDLTVFVFDGDETEPTRAKPIKVYQFKAESLPKHYAFKKPLGHGYDFFLPFDEIGGEEKRLCVMTRFDDRLEGSFVLSPPVNTILQGTKPEATPPNESVREYLASKAIMTEANRQAAEQSIPPEMNPIRQASFENVVESTADNKAKAESRTMATIALNDSMSRRIGQGQTAIQEQASTPVTPEPVVEPERKPKTPTDKKFEFPAPPF